MPYFTSVTRSGVRVSLQEGERSVAIGGVTVSLPAEAGAGIDVVAADVGSDIWAVCIGVNSDRGYLLKRNDQSVTVLGDGKVRGRYAVWVTESGDVSWVPNNDPYAVEHLNGTRSESRDTHHPLSPNELLIEDWGPVRVVQTFRSDQWTVGEDVSAPNGHTRIYARSGAGAPLFVWSGFAPLPAHLCAHPDGSCTVAIQIPKGEFVPVFVHSSEFEDVAPDPEPEPEPMPEPPDHSHIIRQVNDAFPHLLQTNTRDTCREFLWRCTWALHQADKRWGFLSKTEGENHVTIPDVGRVAIDAVTYRDWDGAVDIIANNSNPPEAGRPFWDVVGKRPSSVWVQPVPFGGSGEPPTPEPEPDPSTHKYMGGGNDTGTCDECGRNRNDAIHAIPASKKPHAYDGGEQDTGQCDICQKPKGDAIHQPGQPQPEPEPEPEPPANDNELRELRKLVEELTNQCERIETRQRDHTALLEGIQLQIEKLGDRVAPAAYEGPIELRAGFIGAVRGTGKFTAVKD